MSNGDFRTTGAFTLDDPYYERIDPVALEDSNIGFAIEGLVKKNDND